MSKKKSKNRRIRHPQTAPAVQKSHPPRPEWESVEADFFARESDIYKVNPVENFEDLDKK